MSFFTCDDCDLALGYFVDTSGGTAVCANCSVTNCLECRTLTTCKVCEDGFNLTSIASCVACTVTGCLYCEELDGSKCKTCNESMGYYINNVDKQCYFQCGDGILVPSDEQCDDNNTVTLDGCDGSCGVETHFSCDSSSPSVCSYASSVVVAFVKSTLETTVCNTLTLTFSITPASDTFGRSDIVWDTFLGYNHSSLTVNTSMHNYASGQLNISYFLAPGVEGQTITFTPNFTGMLPAPSIFDSTTGAPFDVTVSLAGSSGSLVCCDGYQVSPAGDACIPTCGDGKVQVS